MNGGDFLHISQIGKSNLLNESRQTLSMAVEEVVALCALCVCESGEFSLYSSGGSQRLL